MTAPLKIIQKQYSLDPNYARAYNNRGTVYCEKGDYDRGIVEFNRAVQLNPDYAEAYYNRGVAYKVKGLVDLAIVDLNKAIQLKPNYADVYKNHWEAWLPSKGVRKDTQSNRVTTRNLGRNITTPFRNANENGPAANLSERTTTMLIAP